MWVLNVFRESFFCVYDSSIRVISTFEALFNAVLTLRLLSPSVNKNQRYASWCIIDTRVDDKDFFDKLIF